MAKSYTFEALGLLHGGEDESFSNIVNLVSRIFGAPVSFISVLDQRLGRQFISASRGSLFDDPSLCDMPIEKSICRHVTSAQRTVAISDLLHDPRTQHNDIVLKEGLRSYIGSPVHALTGKVIGAVCCMTSEPRSWSADDIETLECLARCVDDIIRARALALEERRVSAKLHDIVSTRSHYIAHVGHEIRTPLTGITATVKLLNMEELASRPTRLVRILDRSADRLLNFVNDILDLAKADIGEHHVDEVETDIADLVDDVLNDFRTLAREKRLGLAVENHLNDRKFLIDRNGFTTILQNLIGNAVKFTDKGSVTVRISEDSYGQLTVDVIDTGIGIAPEFHTRIFEEFEQADGNIARTYGGTGLGMSIVKRTVERMDGDITVRSRPGEGTTVSVALPVKEIRLTEVSA